MQDLVSFIGLEPPSLASSPSVSEITTKLQESPKNGGLWLALARVLQADEQYLQAQKAFDNFLEYEKSDLINDPEVLREILDNNLELSRQAFTDERIEESLNYLRQGYDLGLPDITLYRFLGRTLQRMERYEEAQSYIAEGLEKLPATDHLTLWRVEADIARLGNDWAGSLLAYLQLFGLVEKENVRRHYQTELLHITRRMIQMNAGSFAPSNNKIQQSYKLLTKYIKGYPTYHKLLFVLARVFRLIERVPEAIKAYEISLNKHENNLTQSELQEIIDFSATVENNTLIEQAQSVAQETNVTVEIPQPAMTGDDYLKLAKKAFSEAKHEEAFELIQNTHELSQPSIQLYVYLARYAQKIQKYKEAQRYLDKGLKLFPDSKSLLIARAEIYSAQKYWNGAQRAYEKLLAMESKPNARQHYQNQIRGLQKRQKQGKSDQTTKKSATSQKKPSHQAISRARQFIKEGNRAFAVGDYETAVQKIEKAYELGLREGRLFTSISPPLRKLNRVNEALQYLDEGLKIVKGNEREALYYEKAQLHSSQKDYKKAALAYESVLQYRKKRIPRRATQLQLSRVYEHIGDLEKAEKVLQEILKEHPQDQVVLNRLNAINKSLQPQTHFDENETEELEIDLPGDIDDVSPMLSRDLEAAEFSHSKILRQGGIPTVSDANFLLDQALQKTSSKFGARYPLFLEAAKAYNELPEGMYSTNKFHTALTNYAMMRSGAIVSQMGRRLADRNIDLGELKWLRDSVTSYSIESLTLQIRVDFSLVRTLLANHLRAQIAYSRAARGEVVLQTVFKQDFTQLFSECLESEIEEEKVIAYESFISWGAASGHVWQTFRRIHGLGKLFKGIYRNTQKRKEVYEWLSKISESPINNDEPPKKVLETVFLKRREQQQAIHRFLNQIRQMPLDGENFKRLQLLWDDFPEDQGALLATDEFELKLGIREILETLSPYLSRSSEERTAILFTARTTIEKLLKLIDEHPTYWGRVGFEPLLMKWQTAIRRIEQRRLKEIQPLLVAELEPEVFSMTGDLVAGGVKISNEGRGTADSAEIVVKLCELNSEKELSKRLEPINREIGVGESYYYSLQFDRNSLPNGAGIPYKLYVELTPLFRNNRMTTEKKEFTFQIEQGNSFTDDDIPWDDAKVPTEQMFKGRQPLIEKISNHLSSRNRTQTYILYGLTRTGKTTILDYLRAKLDLQAFRLNRRKFRFITFEWHLGKAAGMAKGGGSRICGDIY